MIVPISADNVDEHFYLCFLLSTLEYQHKQHYFASLGI